MKRSRIIGVGLIASALLVGGVALNPNLTEPVSASTGKIELAQIQPNKAEFGGWSINVTKVVFCRGNYDPRKEVAEVYLAVTNDAGLDKAFLPKGEIVGLVGTSGTVYPVDFRHTFTSTICNLVNCGCFSLIRCTGGLCLNEA